MTNIPDKYLNTNVRAMLNGGIKEEPEPEPEPEYVFLLDKLISFFKNKYRLEVKLSRKKEKEVS